MTMPEGLIPSKNFDVWTRLYQRYTLEPGPLRSSRAAVGLTVQPITDADRLLQTARVTRFTLTVAGIGIQSVATVPAGERWTLGPMAVNLDSGTWTHSQIHIEDPVTGQSLEVLRYTATGGIQLFELGSPMDLDPGWSVQVNIAAFTSGGDLVLDLYRIIQEAF